MVPNLALNYTVYGALKQQWLMRSDLEGAEGTTWNQPIGLFGTVVCGSASAVVSSSFTFPIDLVRRRLQLEGFGSVQKVYSGPLDCAQSIVRSEGWGGLYRGIVPEFMKVIPGVCLTWVFYEGLKEHLA
jgi:hypothetical protein